MLKTLRIKIEKNHSQKLKQKQTLKGKYVLGKGFNVQIVEIAIKLNRTKMKKNQKCLLNYR